MIGTTYPLDRCQRDVLLEQPVDGRAGHFLVIMRNRSLASPLRRPLINAMVWRSFSNPHFCPLMCQPLPSARCARRAMPQLHPDSPGIHEARRWLERTARHRDRRRLQLPVQGMVQSLKLRRLTGRQCGPVLSGFTRGSPRCLIRLDSNTTLLVSASSCPTVSLPSNWLDLTTGLASLVRRCSDYA